MNGDIHNHIDHELEILNSGMPIVTLITQKLRILDVKVMGSQGQCQQDNKCIASVITIITILINITVIMKLVKDWRLPIVTLITQKLHILDVKVMSIQSRSLNTGQRICNFSHYSHHHTHQYHCNHEFRKKIGDCPQLH